MFFFKRKIKSVEIKNFNIHSGVAFFTNGCQILRENNIVIKKSENDDYFMISHGYEYFDEEFNFFKGNYKQKIKEINGNQIIIEQIIPNLDRKKSTINLYLDEKGHKKINKFLKKNK